MSIGAEMKYFEISLSKKYLLGYLLWDIIIIKRQMIILIERHYNRVTETKNLRGMTRRKDLRITD